MNAVERIGMALHGEKTDRVPVIPEIIQHSLEIAGVKHRAYSTDARVMAKAQILTQEAYGFDAVYVSSDNYILAEALGGTVAFPCDDAPPQLLRHPIEDICDHRLPAFDVQAGRIPVILEATRLCREHYGNDIYVKTCTDSAPFSLAACLCGPENWMVGLLDEEDHALRLLEECTQIVIDMGIAAARAGAHAIAFGDSPAGLVSRQMYERFALPYVRSAIADIHRATGLPVYYHICGNVKHILDLMVESGADCLEMDSMVDLREAGKLAAGRCALEGNVSTIQAFLQGTKKDVRREADALLAYFQNRGGFILGSACEIPRHSPKENVQELMLAALEFAYDD